MIDTFSNSLRRLFRLLTACVAVHVAIWQASGQNSTLNPGSGRHGDFGYDMLPPWRAWGLQPSYIPFQIDVRVKGQSNTTFIASTLSSLSNSMASVTNVAFDCSTYTNTPRFEIYVKPDEPFILTVEGTNILSVKVTLPSPHTLDTLGSRTRDEGYNLNMLKVPSHIGGRSSAPARYATFVDGIEKYSFEHQNTNSSCSPYQNSWWIEVRSSADAKRRLGWGLQEDVPDQQAPGDGEWPALGPGKSMFPQVAPIAWSASMGRLNGGKSAGRIFYRESGLNSNSYTPAALFFSQVFTNHTNVVVRKQPVAGLLRQIRTPQTLLDIPWKTNNSFELRYYSLSHVSANTNSSGFYDIVTDTPFVVWRFTNTSANVNVPNRLRVLEIRPGITYTNDFAYDSTNMIWSLSRGSGSDQYREYRAISTNTVVVYDEWMDPILTNYCRIETNWITDLSGREAYRAVENYQTFDWGWELTSVVTDPAGSPSTNSFEYCEDGLSGIFYPDGSWEKRFYGSTTWWLLQLPSAVTSIWKPYKDTPYSTNLTAADVCRIDFGYDVNGYGIYTPDPNYWWYNRDTKRYAQNLNYMYENTRQEWGGYSDYVEPIERIKYQIGGIQDLTSQVKEGALKYLSWASASLFGQNALTVSNYYSGTTNAYDMGQWSGTSFTTGEGADWRKIATTGLGYLQDNESYIYLPGDVHPDDTLQVMPGKSTRTIEIRSGGVPIYHEFHIYSGAVTNGTNFDLVFKEYQTNDSLGHFIGSARVDALTSAARTLRTADWQGTNSLPGQLLLEETEENGGTTKYAYDGLKRLKTKTMVGAGGLPDYVISFTYDARGRMLATSTNAGGLTLANGYRYDYSDRILNQTNHEGLVTTYAYPSNGLVTQITLPGGATHITTRYLSGEVKSETGTAIVNKFYDHSFYHVNWSEENLEFEKRTNALSRTTTLADPGSTRWQKAYYNMWNFPIREEINGSEGSTVMKWYYYANIDDDVTCAMSRSLDPAKPIEQYQAYDWEHNPAASWTYVDGRSGPTSYQLEPVPISNDRLTKSDHFFAYTNGAWFRIERSYTYLTDANSAPTHVSEVQTRINGFTSGVLAESVTIDANTNASTQTTFVDRAAKTITVKSTSANSTLPATNITVNGLLQSASTTTVPVSTTYTYDALRRPTRVTSPLGASTSTTYDAANGRITSTTDFAGNTTSYEYYPASHANAGRLKYVTGPTGKKTYYEYSLRGETIHIWGDVPYPEERVYDDYGQMTQLRTYRGGTGWTSSLWPTNTAGTADTTTWGYSAYNGLLLNKQDAQGNSVTNGYYMNRWPQSRRWARGVTASYAYTAQGDQWQINYSDGTPSVTFTNHNRQGLPRTIIDGIGERSLAYDHAGRLISDTGVSGLLVGITFTNHYDAVYGRDYLDVRSDSTTFAHHAFAYDTYDRLGSVTNGPRWAEYGYLPNSDRLQSTTFKNGGVEVMRTVRGWEYGQRLISMVNLVTNSVVSSREYMYDPLHRRTMATHEDDSRWRYGYNDRNELNFAQRAWPDWTPVCGQQFTYAFDTIGNRTSASSGGDANGQNLRTATYTANGLNQYSQVVTPGYKDVVGVAIATNAVTVNGGSCDRKGEYFHNEIPIANTSNPLWQGVTNVCGATTNAGSLAFPKNTQTLTYDADGNLVFDGIWNYHWDGENRLIEMNMTNVGGVPSGERKKLKFNYDYLGRRVLKMEDYWNGLVFTSTGALGSNRGVYDGWKLLVELRISNARDAEYTWGQDLSGTMDKAGGVGGVLMVNYWSEDDHFPAYDGNGNIVALVKTNKSISARYEYSPFGESIRTTGSMAKFNPFRWSTKYTDEQSGLVYYGCRFYSAGLGRWVSRDPAEEQAGVNLFLFVNNCPVIIMDVNGRWGVQFGDFKIGVGQPNLAFDASSWGDLGQGFFAVVDGIIPFGNPFGSAGAYDQNDPTLIASRQLGTFARDIALTAVIPNFSTWAKNPLLYEIGQKALADEVYVAVKNMDAISRGAALLKSQRFWKAFMPALDGNYAAALGDGLTPGLWMLIGGVAEAVDQFFVSE